jgi:hypothetical protein
VFRNDDSVRTTGKTEEDVDTALLLPGFPALRREDATEIDPTTLTPVGTEV